MIKLRNAGDRGHANHGWLDTYHSFSFGEYYDPNHMGFHSLRVINEDRVEPGQGFGTHGHKDMEIISYVLQGELEHKDSMGNGSTLKAGDLQLMSAGSGITHSEYNPSKTSPVHFYQIWISPEKQGLTPGYQERSFVPKKENNGLALIASEDGRNNSLSINQNASVFLAALEPGQETTHLLKADRGAWVQVLRGSLEVNSTSLAEGDGAAMREEGAIVLRANSAAEVMLFDLK